MIKVLSFLSNENCFAGHGLSTTAVDAELAGHAHTLDMNLQSLCGDSFSLFTVSMLSKPYRVGVN